MPKTRIIFLSTLILSSLFLSACTRQQFLAIEADLQNGGADQILTSLSNANSALQLQRLMKAK